MQLGGIAAHADTADPAHEAGIEMARAEKIYEGRFRIDRRDNEVRLDLFAACELDATGAILLDDDALDASPGARLDAERLSSFCHGIGDGTHAAARQCQSRLHAIRSSCEPIVEEQERVRRT